jgi:hypothetical protein
MGTTLTGTTPQDTYDSLIKVTDNGPLSGTLKALSDGLGNDSSLSLSTTAASIAGTLAVSDALTIGASKALNWGARGAISQNGSYDFNWSTNGVANAFNIVSATGNVGIGTSAPAQLLTLQNGNTEDVSGSRLRMNMATNAYWELQANNGGTSADRKFVINTSAAAGDVLTLTQAGNVGIGTNAPASMLTLNGTTPFIRIERTGVPTWQIQNNTIVSDAGFSINNLTNAATPFFINGTTNNVGIGTGAPASRLVVVSNDPSQVSIEASTGDVNSQINLKPSGTGIAYIKNQANTDFAFGTNNTERIRILASGGLTFNGDTLQVNALDDYEEGTFTPTNAGDATGVVSSATGTYTKIGNVVHFRIIVGITTTFTSNAIGGLPYTVAGGGSSSLYGGMIAYNDSDSDLSATLNAASTNILIYSGSDTNAATSPTSTMGILRISGTYFAS